MRLASAVGEDALLKQLDDLFEIGARFRRGTGDQPFCLVPGECGIDGLLAKRREVAGDDFGDPGPETNHFLVRKIEGRDQGYLQGRRLRLQTYAATALTSASLIADPPRGGMIIPDFESLALTPARMS